jgi:hypothetical protein
MTIAIARLLYGLPADTLDIPENLLILLGISAAVTPISVYISGNKYKEETAEAEVTARETKGETLVPDKEEDNKESPNEKIKRLTAAEIIKRREERGFGSMFLENDRPSLPRFQMFSWTIIGVLIYLGIFFTQLNKFISGGAMGASEISGVLSLPDISFTLVALMGISQAAYLGGKYVSPKKPMVFPGLSPNPAIIGQEVTIKGFNFGTDIGSVRLGMEEKPITISSKTIKWNKDTITFTVPKLLKMDSEQSYPVTVFIKADEYIAPESLVIKESPKPKIVKATATTDEEVTIVGENFGQDQGQVLLDDKVVDIKDWKDSLIVVKNAELEPNKGYNVKLLIDSKFEASKSKFVLLSKPQITEIPKEAFENSEVEIKGVNFGNEMGRVTIGGKPVNEKSIEWSDTKITFVMPNQQKEKDYDVAIVIDDVSYYPSSKTIAFFFVPTITKITGKASKDEKVSIEGEHFGKEKGQVIVGSKPVDENNVEWNDTKIIFEMPDLQTGKYNVEVVVAGKPKSETSIEVS